MSEIAPLPAADAEQRAQEKYAAGSNSEERKGAYFERVRSLVVHEDDLVNNRLTWLLTVEGFLIAGFVVAQQSVLSNNQRFAVVAGTEVLFAIIFLGAAWICYITGVNISAAFAQVAAVRVAWVKRYGVERRPQDPIFPRWFRDPIDGEKHPDETSPAEYPPVFGSYRYRRCHLVLNYLMSATRIPFILLVINLAAVVASLSMIGVFAERPNPNKASSADVTTGPGGVHIAITLDGDKPHEELARELELVVRALEGRPATQP